MRSILQVLRSDAVRARRVRSGKVSWGNWSYDVANAILAFDDGEVTYEVDLLRVRNSESALDWIVQVAEKPWSSSKDVGDLVRAMNELFLFQMFACSGAMLGQPGRAFKPEDLLQVGKTK